jgi:hypothetical protein
VNPPSNSGFDKKLTSGNSVPVVKEPAMPKDDRRQAIVLDEKAQEQPADKERAQKANKTEKEDELQPLKEKSGF